MVSQSKNTEIMDLINKTGANFASTDQDNHNMKGVSFRKIDIYSNKEASSSRL